jgi:hypothetical protein
MYKIIGADRREYGPVELERLRQWIAEGRVDGWTLVQAEGGTEWKPLASFPELAALLPSSVPPRIRTREPRSKLAAGLLGILLGAWGVHRFYLGYIGIGIVQILVTLCTCGLGALWGFIEGILIISGNSITTDARGLPLKD